MGSSSSQKPEHLPDAAIQTHVLRQCGITVERAEIMHLNREFRFPDEGDLFQRTDVTTPVEQMLGEVPDEIERQLDTIGGLLPEVAIGAHCFEPRDCPFMNRCRPDSPRHIGKLYSATDDAEALRTRIPQTRDGWRRDLRSSGRARLSRHRPRLLFQAEARFFSYPS